MRPRLNHDSIRHQFRTPAGHPEDYLEGFAQIYREAATKIRGGTTPLLPGIMEGLSGMRFIETLRASSDQGGEDVKSEIEGTRTGSMCLLEIEGTGA
ncbi:hypothetical protein [Scandinavium goeteborgense]|uniref:hypothetical protein n=1 Tax=Scandinavium goeteborgense TaxID=1851514 RepID=UPI002001AF14|nr:hypothetical protein [Scandinavium goeteborgense]